MDFSQIFQNVQNNVSSAQTFEDKVTAQNQATGEEKTQNQPSTNNMFEKLLPLLAGGKNLDENNLMQLLGNSNSQMGSLMSLMPMIKNIQNKTSKKRSKKTFEYIKIKDYYKK